ncbi:MULTISPECIES: hypothetical protein [Gordonia]|uniref:Uncharacterized protein n=2 Tax=Gordonia terrae TaxID=2055 RepID=A0AAD0KBH1_9ACTN|nr:MULTISPECIES: hypothetical protein [Gordonia]VTR02317.1 Uncharacterised protein [Clostridioides difficile]ANY23705.1 hypothetical protein BCM27_13685 [Gordonia terrae]AWO84439.1 hypothetical protein DLJ61_13810 [Gordonia terrae]MCG7631006.1 hypothetical protein [Gordonia sp. McavH-238-E]UPW07076.1 hypothetical protein M1C59_13295 [Gordonia terrae]
MKKTLNSLSESEYLLVRETKKSQMAGLDEDGLIDLHSRIRRARNKHVTLYRRAGAEKVKAKGGRGSAKAANVRNAAKAEVFEDALSRVSRRLARVSRDAALELKAERLARARTENPAPSTDGGKPRKNKNDSKGKVASSGRIRTDDTRDSPGRKKYEASTIAAGARRQTKKDRRHDS